MPSDLLSADALLAAVENRRQHISLQLDDQERSSLGQFFTPSPVGTFISALPTLPVSGTVRILDPGSGIGSLTASLVARIIGERPDLSISVTAVEVDRVLVPELRSTLTSCQEYADRAGVNLTTRIIEDDFLEWASASEGVVTGDDPERFDIIIMNPPYRKVNTGTRERRALQRIGVDVSNLYVAFLALSSALLDAGGQITAITPRSFANGPYFKSFRRYFFGRMEFAHLHVFESRSSVFAGDAVLQENIIFCARMNAGSTHPDVIVSASVGAGEGVEGMTSRLVPYDEVISPNDPDYFVHIVADDEDAAIGHTMALLPTRLPHLGFEVSTGRVVDFRAREHLRDKPSPDTVPLLYQGNLRGGGILWPGSVKKPTSIVACSATAKLLLPTETYVLVKRFTAKEERRRVAASVFEPADIPTAWVGFENHLNVFHIAGHGLDGRCARGLAAWLNSTVVDRYFRSFNGHTQVNATDLRRLPYPSMDELLQLGEAIGAAPTADQEKIDALVTMHVREWQSVAA